MKIIACELFETYTLDSCIEALKELGCSVSRMRYYTPEDYYKDDRLCEMLRKDMKRGCDAVFTVNFWPLVARVSHELSIPYISWSYDSPMNLATDDDMEYDTNYIFMFDRGECEVYQSRGITRVFHMPLATDTALWDRVKTPSSPVYDVSYMGNIYESTFPQLFAALGKHEQGFWNGVIKAQLKVYGYYFVDELLDDEHMTAVNKALAAAGIGDISKKQFAYSLGSYLAYQDRVMLLSVLSKRVNMAFATFSMPEDLLPLMPELKVLPRLDYRRGMPEFFKSSRININSSLRIIKTGIPLRAMDIMGAGGFLLSDIKQELAEYFVPGEEIELYDSVECAVDKCRYYLSNDEARHRIARAGYEKVKRDFGYKGQLEKMLRSCHEIN